MVVIVDILRLVEEVGELRSESVSVDLELQGSLGQYVHVVVGGESAKSDIGFGTRQQRLITLWYLHNASKQTN